MFIIGHTLTWHSQTPKWVFEDSVGGHSRVMRCSLGFATTLGVKVNITELDVDLLPQASQNRTADVGLRAASNPALNPYAAGLPDSMQDALAR